MPANCRGIQPRTALLGRCCGNCALRSALAVGALKQLRAVSGQPGRLACSLLFACSWHRRLSSPAELGACLKLAIADTAVPCCNNRCRLLCYPELAECSSCSAAMLATLQCLLARRCSLTGASTLSCSQLVPAAAADATQPTPARLPDTQGLPAGQHGSSQGTTAAAEQGARPTSSCMAFSPRTVTWAEIFSLRRIDHWRTV